MTYSYFLMGLHVDMFCCSSGADMCLLCGADIFLLCGAVDIFFCEVQSTDLHEVLG